MQIGPNRLSKHLPQFGNNQAAALLDWGFSESCLAALRRLEEGSLAVCRIINGRASSPAIDRFDQEASGASSAYCRRFFRLLCSAASSCFASQRGRGFRYAELDASRTQPRHDRRLCRRHLAPRILVLRASLILSGILGLGRFLGLVLSGGSLWLYLLCLACSQAAFGLLANSGPSGRTVLHCDSQANTRRSG